MFIRVLLSALLILLVLFLDFSSSAMIILLILSSLLCLIDLCFDYYSDIKQKKYFSNNIIVITVTIVLYIASYEFEAAYFALLYRVSLIITVFIKNYLFSKFSAQLNPDEINTLDIILSYKNSAVLNTERQLRSSVSAPLLAIAVISILVSFLMPGLWHFNSRISIYRGLMVLFLSSSYSLFVSMNLIGRLSLCCAAKKGIFFNCAENLEKLDFNGIINSDFSSYDSDYNKLIINSSIDQDTFINMVAHIVDRSNQSFAEVIKKNIDINIDPSIVSDVAMYNDIGIIATINDSKLLFGYPEFLEKLGLNNDSFKEGSNRLYLYFEDRYIGDIETPEINVSDTRFNYLSNLSVLAGKLAKQNCFGAFIIKAILISLSIIGLMTIWLIVLIDLLVCILELFYVNYKFKTSGLQ